ncbi:MAG: hypothetical protein D6681_06030 [Calditrichaeota bacterium]|nr:MAG: hypothetical protein D6681_06030 [Calditrichota bacterium]
MKKFFALATIDDSFIVSADTEKELEKKIEAIKKNYRAYYKRFVEPGYYVVEADSLREAKQQRRKAS